MSASRTFTFLGTGTSAGVPMVGCECAVCQSTNPKNHRYRCSVLISTPNGNILIDTPPELRLQLIRERVSLVHSVLYTHYHVDHLFGLDDLRQFPRKLGGPVPIYCSDETEQIIRTAFGYVFQKHPDQVLATSWPRLDIRRISNAPFEVLGECVTPIPLIHAHFNVFGFRFGDVAYCTDVNRIPESSWPLLQGLDVLVLDCLRHKPHPAHMSMNEALAVVERVKPKKTYFTHMMHDLEHEETNRTLPARVELAYDGLKFTF